MNPSLIQAIQQYYGMLQQQQMEQQGLGINPQIQQAQNAGNMQQLQAGQGILNAPTAEIPYAMSVDNKVANTTGPEALKYQALLAMAPQFQKGMDRTGFSDSGIFAGQMRQWEKAVDNAKYDMNASATYRNPQEVQAGNDAATVAHMGAGQGLLQGVKPQAGVNPELLGKYAEIAQRQLGEETKATSSLNVENLKGQYGLQGEKVKAQGQIDAETAKAGLVNSKLSKATKAQMEQKIAANQATLVGLGEVAKTFNPKLYTFWGKTRAALGGYADSLGIPIPDAEKKYQSEFATFQTSVKDVFNQYRKSITGAAASVQELKMLEESIFNTKMPPTQAKSALVNLMVKMQTESSLANQLIKTGIAEQQGLTPGTEAFGNFVESQFQKPEAAGIRDKVRAEIIKLHPNLADGPTESASGKDISSLSDDDLRRIASGGK